MRTARLPMQIALAVALAGGAAMTTSKARPEMPIPTEPLHKGSNPPPPEGPKPAPPRNPPPSPRMRKALKRITLRSGAHQGKQEQARRLRQMERAAAKQAARQPTLVEDFEQLRQVLGDGE